MPDVFHTTHNLKKNDVGTLNAAENNLPIREDLFGKLWHETANRHDFQYFNLSFLK